jgi:hypothetical protein
VATKITFIGAAPVATTGADVVNNGPVTPAVLDQNFANMRSTVDTAGGNTAAIAAIVAGTTPAGDAQKLGAIAAASFWNNVNCTKTAASVNRADILASGLIIQKGEIYGVTNTLVTFPTPFLENFSISLTLRESPGPAYSYSSTALTGFAINHDKGSAATFTWIAIGR